MPLKLMYITNRPDVAAIAERNGVDRIFVDMEYIGKAERQGKMDTVQNHHTVEDVKRVRAAITDAELLVRVNPIHDATDEYCSSEEEIQSQDHASSRNQRGCGNYRRHPYNERNRRDPHRPQ